MTLETSAVAYAHDGLQLTGQLVSDNKNPAPGLLLIHGGGGLDDHARTQARRYAKLGYTVLACDMFGGGVVGDRERVMSVLKELRDDPKSLVARGTAGLEALTACPEVQGKVAVVGFCFGGLAALTLARSGADLAGVISMHGSLATSKPAEAGAIRGRLLVCHGALDPHVPMAQVTAFCEEMTAAAADWELIIYGGAMHGFTHGHAVPGAMSGVEYHPETDRRSFDAARQFLAEVL